jgi:CheY-like chemotaxis protein
MGWSPQSRSVLVVDADGDTRSLYRHAFERAGFSVIEACDGRGALARALTAPPTLVVTEIVVPLLDGCALCEILRRDRTTAHIPIVVVTADARPLTIAQARRAGADLILIKPVPLEPLLKEMQRLADERSRRGGRASTGEERSVSRHETDTPGSAAPPHRTVLSQSASRFGTATAPTSPPVLRCPYCDRVLTYARHQVGGVNDDRSEQWDYYSCPASCGTFQYRQRTRRVRHVS